MKKFFLFTNLFFLCLVMGFSAYATDVGGPIEEDTIWTKAGSPYVVIENVTVMIGVTLTIEPSVEVKFDQGKSLIIDGTLVARGISDDKIIFTSNGEQTPGYWGYISFTDSSADATFDPDGNYTGGCIIQYALVQYGGSGSSAITITASSPFLDNSTIENNANAGISITAGSPLISNCEIKSNSGGGIALGAGGISTIKNCMISKNSGSGISANNCAILIQDGTTISENSSGGGGGISASSCTITIQNSTINKNSASGGGDRYGGGISASSCTVLIQDSMISANSCYGDYNSFGGSVYVSSSTVIIQNCTISANSTSAGMWSSHGGGIYAESSTITIQNSTISANSSSHGWAGGGSYGGGVYASSSPVTIQNSTISANTAQTHGGGIYAGSSNVTIQKNSTISANSADGVGGGVYANSSTVTIQNITLNSNDANTGGGVYAENNTVLAVRDSVLTANSSAANGGGIWSNYNATIEGNTFKDNSAIQQGGAIWASGTVIIKNNILTKNILGNTAPYGAAIYASGTVTLQKNEITQNMAPNLLGCVLRLVDISSDSIIGGSEENTNVIKDNFGDGVYFKGESAFSYNCVYNNEWYEFVSGNPFGSDIDATNCYWGTTDESKIKAEIWDCEDDDALACVTYIPFLTECPICDTGAINGHVTDADTGKPIKYALVIAIQQPEKKGTFTGPYNGWPDGYYEIKDLQPGAWLLICKKKGYKTGIAKVIVEACKITTKDFQLTKSGEENEDEFADLYANYPNPFNPDTWIPYSLSQDADVTIRIFNSAGRLVRTLDLGRQVAGIYIDKDKAAYWDGKDDLGQQVASGVYYYAIQAGNFSATRKMVIMK